MPFDAKNAQNSFVAEVSSLEAHISANNWFIVIKENFLQSYFHIQCSTLVNISLNESYLVYKANLNKLMYKVNDVCLSVFFGTFNEHLGYT